MSFEFVLAELKAEFKSKRLLTLAEVAPLLGKTVAAVRKLKLRNKLPFEVVEVGGNHFVSIYAVAELLSGTAPVEQQKPSSPPVAAEVPPPTPKKSPSTKQDKPFRRPNIDPAALLEASKR